MGSLAPLLAPQSHRQGYATGGSVTPQELSPLEQRIINQMPMKKMAEKKTLKAQTPAALALAAPQLAAPAQQSAQAHQFVPQDMPLGEKLVNWLSHVNTQMHAKPGWQGLNEALSTVNESVNKKMADSREQQLQNHLRKREEERYGETRSDKKLEQEQAKALFEFQKLIANQKHDLDKQTLEAKKAKYGQVKKAAPKIKQLGDQLYSIEQDEEGNTKASEFNVPNQNHGYTEEKANAKLAKAAWALQKAGDAYDKTWGGGNSVAEYELAVKALAMAIIEKNNKGVYKPQDLPGTVATLPGVKVGKKARDTALAALFGGVPEKVKENNVNSN
jgi:hypothetical protein